MHDFDKIDFEEFRNGNEEVFAKIFNKYYAPLCSFASNYLLDKDACEDVVQELMISVWLKKSEFKSVNSFRTYLYSAVKNKALNVIKHSKVKDKYREEIQFLKTDGHFIDKIIEEEVHAILFNSYNSLPKKCCEVFKLSYLEGLRLKEIAAQLNISVNTVKTQKYRALKIIRKNFHKLNKCIVNFPLLFP